MRQSLSHPSNYIQRTISSPWCAIHCLPTIKKPQPAVVQAICTRVDPNVFLVSHDWLIGTSLNCTSGCILASHSPYIKTTLDYANPGSRWFCKTHRKASCSTKKNKEKKHTDFKQSHLMENNTFRLQKLFLEMVSPNHPNSKCMVLSVLEIIQCSITLFILKYKPPRICQKYNAFVSFKASMDTESGLNFASSLEVFWLS